MEEKLCLGYVGLIKPEIDLISTILRTSSRLEGEWVLVDNGRCDAILAYSEDDLGQYILKSTTQLILIKRRGENYSGFAFFKPFRADELVDTLILIQDTFNGTPAKGSSTAQTLYRLKRWPPNSLLAQHKYFTLLAVYLSRGSKTLENLVTLSGQNEKYCKQFIHMLEDRDLVAEETKVVEIVPVKNTRQAESKKTFLSQLKTRLRIG